MKIRKATKSDAANISAVGVCVWVDTYATKGVFDEISKYVTTEVTAENISLLITNKDVFVIENENSILGYMVLGPENNNKIEIETLYILPKFQNKGLGSLLIEKAINRSNHPLWLSTWEENTGAIKFYKKLGFKEQGELFFDLYGKKIRNIVFEKHLKSTSNTPHFMV